MAAKFNFGNYTIGKSGSLVKDPKDLATLSTMTQLRRFAEKLDVTINTKGSKVKAAEAIFAAMPEPVKSEKKEKRGRLHTFTRPDDLKKTTEGLTPMAQAMFAAVLKGVKTGEAVELNKEQIMEKMKDAGIKTQSKNFWSCILWYKADARKRGLTIC